MERFLIVLCVSLFGIAVLKISKDEDKAYQRGYAEGVRDFFKEVKPALSERDSIIYRFKDLAVFYHNKTFQFQDKLDSIYGNKRLNPVPKLK